MAETQYSLRIVKHFNYQGDATQQWSNRYHFDGGAPTDSTAWHNLFDAIVDLEQAFLTPEIHFDAAFGYAPGSQVAVASKTYTSSGALTMTSGAGWTPGDCAVVLRHATTKRSTKNHPVYCFSYYHGAKWNVATAPDELWTSQKSALEGVADDWVSGIVVGGRTYKRTTPDGHPVTGRLVHTYIGHRDFVN